MPSENTFSNYILKGDRPAGTDIHIYIKEIYFKIIR